MSLKLLSLLLTLLLVQPTFAADVGIFSRPDVSSVTSPISGKSWVFTSNDKRLYVYDGSAWREAIPPKSSYAKTANPGVNDDSTQGYLPGSLWYNSTSNELWLCSNAAIGAAKWEPQSNRIALSDVAPKLTTVDLFSDWAVSGFASSVPVSTLSLTTPSGVAYVNGVRLSVGSSAYTYTASKDTYDYLQSDGTYIHPAVNNGNSAPTGQPGVLVQKVVTNGSAITAITKLIPSLPQLNIAAAGSINNAVNLAQGDARYSPISTYNYFNTSMPANTFQRAPSGGGLVTVGPITTADLPIIPTAGGGTGAALTGTVNKFLVGVGSGVVGELAAPTAADQILGSASGWTGSGGLSDFVWAPNYLAGAGAPTSGQIPVGGGSNKYVSRTVSGDLTAASTGAFTIGANAVSNSKLATMANNTVKGNVSGSTAAPSDLTATQLTTLVNVFSTTLSGAVPASGGGTTNFLRADGAFAAPTIAQSIPTQGICNFRLTLTTVTPVTSSDVTAATTLYCSPFKGNQIGLYDGSTTWNLRSSAELSLSLSGLAANTNYDIFIYDNAGTAALRSPVAWTNDTTRATALVLQNGVLVKSGATTDRYLGTIRTTATIGQTEDSVARRYVSNYYNRFPRILKATDATATWTYNSATYRPFNNSTTDGTGQFSYVQGFAEEPLTVSATALFGGSVSSTQEGFVGIGVDSTTVSSGTILAPNITALTNGTAQTSTSRSEYFGFPGIGKHTFSALERCDGTNSLTFCGTNGAATSYQSGMTGILWN